MFWGDSQFRIRDVSVYFPLSVKPHCQVGTDHCSRKTFPLFQEELQCSSPGLPTRIGYLWPRRCGSARDAGLFLGGRCHLIHSCWDVAKSVNVTLGKVPCVLGSISAGVTWKSRHLFLSAQYLFPLLIIGASLATANCCIMT